MEKWGTDGLGEQGENGALIYRRRDKNDDEHKGEGTKDEVRCQKK